jgi:hypothetical protein
MLYSRFVIRECGFSFTTKKPKVEPFSVDCYTSRPLTTVASPNYTFILRWVFTRYGSFTLPRVKGVLLLRNESQVASAIVKPISIFVVNYITDRRLTDNFVMKFDDFCFSINSHPSCRITTLASVMAPLETA